MFYQLSTSLPHDMFRHDAGILQQSVELKFNFKLTINFSVHNIKWRENEVTD